jgi:hypothetical protein
VGSVLIDGCWPPGRIDADDAKVAGSVPAKSGQQMLRRPSARGIAFYMGLNRFAETAAWLKSLG